MIYDLAKHLDRRRAEKRFAELIKEGTIIELTKKVKRSLSQNNYLYLILSWFANETGYTTVEAKCIYKDLSPSIFYYSKNGRRFIRSTADLTTKEMTDSIEKFRNYSSAEAGIYLPAPNEEAFLDEILIELSKNNYL